MAEVHEFVVMEFKEGISKEEQTEAMKEFEQYIAACEGFKLREIFYSDEDNRWIDHIIWESMELADNADKIIAIPEVAAILAKTDSTKTVFSLTSKVS